MHPSSVLYGQDKLPEPFLIYHEKVKTSKVRTSRRCIHLLLCIYAVSFGS